MDFMWCPRGGGAMLLGQDKLCPDGVNSLWLSFLHVQVGCLTCHIYGASLFSQIFALEAIPSSQRG